MEPCCSLIPMPPSRFYLAAMEKNNWENLLGMRLAVMQTYTNTYTIADFTVSLR